MAEIAKIRKRAGVFARAYAEGILKRATLLSLATAVMGMALQAQNADTADQKAKGSYKVRFLE